MASLRLKIVTPEGSAYDADADYVSLPTVDGEIGVYPSHTPLLTVLKAGELNVRNGNETLALAVGEGFVEITADHVSVLTDSALKEVEIDEKSAEEAIRRAQERLAEKHLSDEEIAATSALIARSIAQLHLKRRKRT